MYIERIDEHYFSIDAVAKTPPSYSIPIWASYITAYARLKLFSLLREHQEQILYCDTDSVFFANGYTIPDGELLGELKHEYNVERAVFVRPKFYYTNRAKVKGVKTRLDFEKFLELVRGDKIEEVFFTKYRSAIRSKGHHKTGKLTINQIVKRSKELSNEDKKGQWDAPFCVDGKQTSTPIVLTRSNT